MAVKNKKKINWKKASLSFVVLIVVLSLIVHVIINSADFQKWALNYINQQSRFIIESDELNFTGATGHFSGNNLRIEVPSSHLEIHVKKFKLAFSPIFLLLKKVRLSDLDVEEVVINIKAFDKNKSKKKTPKRRIGELVNLFQIDQGNIKKLVLKLPDKKALRVGQVEISREPFIFYRRSFDIVFKDIDYRSPKFDLFGQKIEILGSFDIEIDDENEKILPLIKGHLTAEGLFLGFNKTPVPWNTAPGWDDSLDKLVQKKYPGLVPQNRAFAFLDAVYLPIHIEKNQLHLNKGVIKAFEGQLGLKFNFNQDNGKLDFALSTKKKLNMSLLPLGKTRFRSAYKEVWLDFSGRGKMLSLLQGEIKSKLDIDLLQNRYTPGATNLILKTDPRFHNGVILLNTINIHLNDQPLTGKASLNLIAKKFSAALDAKNFDVETVVHLTSTLDIPGKADVKGTVLGSFDNPLFNFKLSSPNFGYETLRFGRFEGYLRIQDHQLDVTGASQLGAGKGSLDLKINEVFRSSKQKLSLNVNINDLPAGDFLQTEALTGSIDGSYEMTKIKEHYGGQGRITLTNGLWYDKIPISLIDGRFLVQKQKLTVTPFEIRWGNGANGSLVNQEFVFDFNDKGFDYGGLVIPNLEVKGSYLYEKPDFLSFKMTARQADISFIKSLFPFDVSGSEITGAITGKYVFKDVYDSTFAGHLSQFTIKGDERYFKLLSKTPLDYKDRKLFLNQANLAFGNGTLTLDGFYAENNSKLDIKGKLDLAQITGLHPKIVEGSGLVDVDLVWSGEDRFDGDYVFKNSSIVVRDFASELTQMTGKLTIEGERYSFNQFRFVYDDAPVKLNGWVVFGEEGNFDSADLTLAGQEMPLSEPDAWRFMSDARLSIKGQQGQIVMAGKMDIVEGLFYKDYSLSQYVLKPVGVAQEQKSSFPKFLEGMGMDIKLSIPGEFIVKNNLANLILNGNLLVQGAIDAPLLKGTINLNEGEVHFLGLTFEDANGFATFRGHKNLNPIIDFSASRDIQNYEVKALVQGDYDNIEVKFESTPSLNQNEILSLIIFGRTPDLLEQTGAADFSTVALASQILSFLERPLSKATQLDIVKLESEYDPNQTNYSRFSIGKRLSDKVSVAFTTDLSLDEAYKGIVFEYLLHENFLLKGSKDAGSRFRFDLTWRLKAH